MLLQNSLLEIAMFKECITKMTVGGAATPASSVAFCSTTYVSARNYIVALSFVLIGATATWTSAEARKNHPLCTKVYNTCLDSCKQRWGTYLEGLRACRNRCGVTLKDCNNRIDPAGKVETPPEPHHPKGTDNSAPMGGAKPDPKKPPKPRNDAPPTGGTKADPKPPKPRDDVRPSGGTKADPKPQSPGNSGPILLRSNGAGQPNSSGSSGASTRANGRK